MIFTHCSFTMVGHCSITPGHCNGIPGHCIVNPGHYIRSPRCWEMTGWNRGCLARMWIVNPHETTFMQR